MTKREVGPARKRFFGDVQGAQQYVGQAMVLLGYVKEQMKKGGLLQWARQTILPNGVILSAISKFGIDEIQVFAPVYAGGASVLSNRPDIIETAAVVQLSSSAKIYICNSTAIKHTDGPVNTATDVIGDNTNIIYVGDVSASIQGGARGIAKGGKYYCVSSSGIGYSTPNLFFFDGNLNLIASATNYDISSPAHYASELGIVAYAGGYFFVANGFYSTAGYSNPQHIFQYTPNGTLVGTFTVPVYDAQVYPAGLSPSPDGSAIWSMYLGMQGGVPNKYYVTQRSLSGQVLQDWTFTPTAGGYPFAQGFAGGDCFFILDTFGTLMKFAPSGVLLAADTIVDVTQHTIRGSAWKSGFVYVPTADYNINAITTIRVASDLTAKSLLYPDPAPTLSNPVVASQPVMP